MPTRKNAVVVINSGCTLLTVQNTIDVSPAQ